MKKYCLLIIDKQKKKLNLHVHHYEKLEQLKTNEEHQKYIDANTNQNKKL